MRNHYNKVVFIPGDEDGALARYSEFVRTCHNMNIVVQNKGRNESYLNGNIEISNKTLSNVTRALILNSSRKGKNCASPINMPYGYLVKLRIGYVVMFLTFSGMYQDFHTNTPKYGV